MDNIFIFVEGGTKSTPADTLSDYSKSSSIKDRNQKLREAFAKLINPNNNSTINIILGFDCNNTVKQAISKKRRSPSSVVKVLVDLDSLEHKEKSVKLKKLNVPIDIPSHFMISELESWFLSQPDILDSRIGSKIKMDEHKSIPNAKERLMQLFAKHTSSKYNEVTTAAELLEKLDRTRLAETFEDFHALIAAI